VGKSAARQQLQVSQKNPSKKRVIDFIFDRLVTPYRGWGEHSCQPLVVCYDGLAGEMKRIPDKSHRVFAQT
jgi:hypothetical protein